MARTVSDISLNNIYHARTQLLLLVQEHFKIISLKIPKNHKICKNLTLWRIAYIWKFLIMCDPKWFKSYSNAGCYNESHIFYAQVALLTKEKGRTVCWHSSPALSWNRNRGGLPTPGFVKHRNLGGLGPGHTVHHSLPAEVFQEHTDKYVCVSAGPCLWVCACLCVCTCVCTAPTPISLGIWPAADQTPRRRSWSCLCWLNLPLQQLQVHPSRDPSPQ